MGGKILVGWGGTPTEPAFGSGGSRDEAASVKGKLVNLISSVRTLMRSEFASINQSITSPPPDFHTDRGS